MSKLVKKSLPVRTKNSKKRNNDGQIIAVVFLLVAFIGLLVFVAIRNRQNSHHLPQQNVVTQPSDVTPTSPTPDTGSTETTSEIGYYDYLASLEYTGAAYKVINNGYPFFDGEYDSEFEIYTSLDYLGRCGTAFAAISPQTIPSERRGDISKVKPSGWHSYNSKEIFGQPLDDNTEYVYNRSHLIAYSLASENANKLNLITGTRYLNINMTDFEQEVLNYVQLTGNHVLYRVTPVFRDTELVARGVLMEAMSVETSDVRFCVYLFNVQPLKDGSMIEIHYDTGEITLPTKTER